MLKIFLPIGAILLIIGGLLIYRFTSSQSGSSLPKLTTQPKEVPASVDDHNKLLVLEQALTKLAEKVNGISSPSPSNPPSSAAFNARLITLESAVASLSGRISKLENSSTTTSSKAASVYIPLGSGSSSATDWSSTSLPQVTINPANFPNYKNMYLEVFMQIFQGNGTAYARLLNSTDGTGVANSDVSTNSESYVLVTSSAFQVPSSQKTYTLQLKTSTGYAANVLFARIRVDF